jgi:ATP-dependent DNA helicase RecG
VYNDRLILWNEGSLPEGWDIKHLFKKHPSKPTNKTIATIFFKAGFIEAWGRGISKITNGFACANLNEPIFEEAFGGILVTLFRKKRWEISVAEQITVKGSVKRSVKNRGYTIRNALNHIKI